MVTPVAEGVAVTNGHPERERNGHVGRLAYGYPYALALADGPITVLGGGGVGGGGSGGSGSASLHGFLLLGKLPLFNTIP